MGTQVVCLGLDLTAYSRILCSWRNVEDSFVLSSLSVCKKHLRFSPGTPVPSCRNTTLISNYFYTPCRENGLELIELSSINKVVQFSCQCIF